jgi:hypothetical protein
VIDLKVLDAGSYRIDRDRELRRRNSNAAALRGGDEPGAGSSLFRFQSVVMRCRQNAVHAVCAGSEYSGGADGIEHSAQRATVCSMKALGAARRARRWGS